MSGFPELDIMGPDWYKLLYSFAIDHNVSHLEKVVNVVIVFVFSHHNPRVPGTR